jgi:hypothetical protein
VDFNAQGIFTVIIGGATPGGIPWEIGFDKPRWLGVTISGFNDGNELPRLRFHGSPYSFEAWHATLADSSLRSARAVMSDKAAFADSSSVSKRAQHADSASRADTAGHAEQLLLPAQLSRNGQDAVLDISNSEGPGLRVNGGTVLQSETVALITRGKDSTTKHYVSAEDAGNDAAPEAGSLYRDNAPLAWATVLPDGSIVADFGVASVNHNPNNPGQYLVSLDNPTSTDGAGRPEIAVVVSAQQDLDSPSSQPVIAGWTYAIDQSSNLPRNDAIQVQIRGFESGVDTRFSVIVFGRPEE